MENLKFLDHANEALAIRADVVELLFGIVDDNTKLPFAETRLMEIFRVALPHGDDRVVMPYVHATLISLAKGDLRFNEVNDAIYAAILKAPFGAQQVTRCLMD